MSDVILAQSQQKAAMNQLPMIRVHTAVSHLQLASIQVVHDAHSARHSPLSEKGVSGKITGVVLPAAWEALSLEKSHSLSK